MIELPFRGVPLAVNQEFGFSQDPINVTNDSNTDWRAWSREAVQLMNARNAEWQSKFQLQDCPFGWDLESATIRFKRPTDTVMASLSLVGTVSESEGTFLWSWANETIVPAARQHLDEVREFGARHDLMLLTEPEFRGGRPEALEVLAIAGRILDAEGVFISPGCDVTYFFVLNDFRVEVS